MTDYFCLSADGELCVLGNHGDFEAAAKEAQKLADKAKSENPAQAATAKQALEKVL